METIEELRRELNEIEKWEKDQKNLFIWEKIGRIPFMILDKLTPKFIHEKIEKILNELSKYIENGGQYLENSHKTLEKSSKILDENECLTIESMKDLSILEMDKLADTFILSRKNKATFQGATTGIGGVFTLAIDIPLILGLTLKTLQEIAVCYGYDPKEQKERIFAVKCMQFSSSDIVGKKAILEEITNPKGNQSMSQIQGWREVMMTYRDNYGWKKLFQMVPIAGIIFGAYINKQSIESIGEAGKMLYKKRRILEKLKTLEKAR